MTVKRRKAYIALLINALIWGAAIPVVKLALPYTTPFRWLFYRYLIAAPLSLPLLFYSARSFKLKFSHIATVIILELIGTTGVLALLYYALSLTSALEASLIVESAPLFMIVGGIIFLKEREERSEWLGFTVAFLGTIFIILEPYLTTGRFTNGGSLFGNLLLLGHNLVWTFYLILIKRAYKKIPKLFITTLSFWVGLVTFGLMSHFSSVSEIITELSVPQVNLSALYMAIPGSLIALTLYLYGVNQIEASEASVFGYLQPLVSLPLAVLWLGDRLSLPIIIGMVIISVGVYVAEIRSHRRK